MAIDKDRLKSILTEAERPVGIKELLRLSGLNPGHQTELKRVLRELLRSGEVDKDGKRFHLPGARKSAKRPAEPKGELPPEPAARPIPARGPRPGGRAGHGGHEDRGPSAGRPAREARGGRAEGFAPRGGDRGAPRGTPRGGQDDRGADRGRDRGQPRAPAAGRGDWQSRSRDRASVQRQKPIATIEGVLHVHRDGFGFVHPLSGEGENIFVPPDQAARALDKDKVKVEVVRERDGRTSGRIVELIDRRRSQVVGTYFDRGRKSFVAPSDPTMQGPIRVPPTQIARDGDLVKVTLGVGEGLVEPGEGLFGEVAGTLGKPGDPSGEVLGIVFSQGFSDEFPAEVMAEADQIPLEVGEDEANGDGRRDLRKLPLVTIDGEDARDFDDAVYAEETEDGWRLVVAIADVTHYVREGTALDREALDRATSVYLPGRVLPMLPERLSAGICSLRPDEDRLCMVADLRIDRSGTAREEEFYPAVMRSAARCTYNEVQAVLDGEDVPHRNAFKPRFQLLMDVARTLNKMRERRGAIDFDLPETRVVLGDDDLPARVEKRERKDSHRLVEECMLAANEAVARHFQAVGEPSVYRFHAQPDEEKLEAFAALAGAYGFNLPSGELTSKALADFLERLEDHPEKRSLNQLLLRSMMQAVYSSENVGHYGLAAEHYLHFTSPIRRYPDLLVHRQLKKLWSRGGQQLSEAANETETERLEAMAVHCSERERAAMQVEREVSAFYAALLMKDRVGEEFDATVASVTDFGFFVELDVEMVEGLVKLESVGPGGKFDQALHSISYPGGRKVKVGMKLRVRLDSVNLQRRQLDFAPVAFEGEEPLAVKRQARLQAQEPRQAERTEDSTDVDRPRFDPNRFLGKGQGQRRHEQPPADAPGGYRPKIVVDPGDEPAVESAPPSSPHPGFDRLRALAAKRGLLKGEEASRGGRPGAHAGARGGAHGGAHGGGRPGARGEGERAPRGERSNESGGRGARGGKAKSRDAGERVRGQGGKPTNRGSGGRAGGGGGSGGAGRGSGGGRGSRPGGKGGGKRGGR